MRILTSFVLTVALAACAKKSPPPQQPVVVEEEAPPADDAPAATASLSDAEVDAIMEETLVFVTELTEATEAAAGDCAKVAAAMSSSIEAHSQFLARARSYDDDKAVQERAETWLAANEERMNPIYLRLGNAIGPCAEDPAVAAQFQRLEGQ